MPCIDGQAGKRSKVGGGIRRGTRLGTKERLSAYYPFQNKLEFPLVTRLVVVTDSHVLPTVLKLLGLFPTRPVFVLLAASPALVLCSCI